MNFSTKTADLAKTLIVALHGIVLIFALCIPLPAHAADKARIEGIAAYRCNACHGPNGQGANPTFPKLAGQNIDYLVKQIMNFKTGVRRGQVMFYQLGDLSVDDVQGLALHYSSIPLIPGAIRDGPRHEAGRQLYFAGNLAAGTPPCIQCHGPAARGDGSMPRMAGQHAEYIAEQIFRFIDADRQAGQTPRHPGVLNLTYEEIRAVSLFLSGLD